MFLFGFILGAIVAVTVLSVVPTEVSDKVLETVAFWKK